MDLRPNEQRAKMAILMLMIVMILYLISLFSDTLEYQLITSGSIDSESAESNDLRQRILGIILIAAIIVCATLFIRWFRRAYYNLHCRISHLDYEEAAARTYWFIPILSLFKPFGIAKEIFKKTEFYLEKNKPNYTSTTSINPVRIWWTFWVLSSLLGYLVARISLNAITIEDFQTVCILNIISDIIRIVAAVFAIRMIKEYGKIETLFYETEFMS